MIGEDLVMSVYGEVMRYNVYIVCINVSVCIGILDCMSVFRYVGVGIGV